MERSPDDVPMTLRFEPKAVVVFNVVHVRAFSWSWLGVLAPSFCHSGAQCTSPGFAFKSPSVGLLSTRLTAVGNHSTTRRGGAQPHTAQSGPESKRGSNCLGNHPRLFQSGALFRPLPRIIVMTLEGCFCERVNLIVSLTLLSFLGRGCLVKCSMRLDPFDLFHVGPVLFSIGRQQNQCIHPPGWPPDCFWRGRCHTWSTTLQSTTRLVSRGATSKANAKPANSPAALDCRK